MSKLFTAEELKNGKMLCNPLFLPLLLNELEAPLTREQIDEITNALGDLREEAAASTEITAASTEITAAYLNGIIPNDELMRSHSYLSAQVNTLVDVLSSKIWGLVGETLKQQKEVS